MLHRSCKDGLQVALEQRTGIWAVLFGVGFGGGDAVKRFVEDADDPPLFGEGRDGDVLARYKLRWYSLLANGAAHSKHAFLTKIHARKEVIQILAVELRVRTENEELA